MSQSMVYLDNNATTLMPVSVRKAFLDWCNRGNPSSSYASAKDARKMMGDFRQYIGTLCKLDTCCREDRDSSVSNVKSRADPAKYKVVFTSGASEANCMALQGVVDAYTDITGNIPHIIMSAIEHKSLIDMAKSFASRSRATVTYVQPTRSGHIRPEDIAAAITNTTAIICVMHANNETGAINDIRKIGAIAHKANIVYHCDTVQTFGKFPIEPLKDSVDSFCVSFHKFQGPPGIGALIIKQQLLLGYKISPMIFGTQNEGLRGGTENLPGIGAAFAATKLTMTDRKSKNVALGKIKKYIMDEIGKRMPTRTYTQYIEAPRGKQPEIEVIFLSGATDYYLPNTILLSVVKRTKPLVCNGEMKSALEAVGVVVSVGSACNTANAGASHVLYAMGCDELIRKGTLRISLGDDSTITDAKKFIQEFLTVIKTQMKK